MTSAAGTADRVVLTVSPHPDDEVLGLGATLTLLLEQSWTMRNLACSLGHAEDRERRLRELHGAGSRLGFTSTVMEPLAGIGRDDDLEQAVVDVADAVTAQIEVHHPAVVISPHLADGHHGHEVVARGVRLALECSPAGPVWWAYGIWNDLPRPNVFVPYDDGVLARVMHALEAYRGENARSHYDLMYPARAVVNRTLGSERVFGFGTATADDSPYADLLTELRHGEAGWQYAAPRLFDASDPLQTSWPAGNVDWWVGEPSLRERWAGAPDAPDGPVARSRTAEPR
jgi:LmbE family N-acetylglucosaminyl deacetylase